MTAKRVCVTTGSRLHLGLLDTVIPFGGVGLMIDDPVTELSAVMADRYYAPHVARERIDAVAANFRDFLGSSELPACQISIRRRPKLHSGLGSGTQLALAAAEAICKLFELEIPNAEIARKIADRGKRSAVGIHGYFSGGLILEDQTDHSFADPINPIVYHSKLPTSWCVTLFRDRTREDLVSGDFEQTQFDKLQPASAESKTLLRAIATKRLLPAVLDSNFREFSAAAEQYNHASGMLFAPVQGGAYNGSAITRLVEVLKQSGATGVGQSSWGPTVFSWFESRQDAVGFVDRVIDQERIEVHYAAARNEPRSIRVFD